MRGYEPEVLAQQPVGKLREAREMLGWNLDQAAGKFGQCSRSHIGRLERGRTHTLLVAYSRWLADQLPEEPTVDQTHAESPEEPPLATLGERAALILEWTARLAWVLESGDDTRKLLGKLKRWRQTTRGSFFRPAPSSVRGQLEVAFEWLEEIINKIEDEERSNG